MSVSLRSFLAGAAFLVVVGCLSPTLPLPPPESPDTVSPSATGTEWTITGSCLTGAEVIGLDSRTGRGAVFVDRDRVGRYSLTIEGEECDVVLVSQTLQGDSSGETRVVLQEISGGVEVDPLACTQ